MLGPCLAWPIKFVLPFFIWSFLAILLASNIFVQSYALLSQSELYNSKNRFSFQFIPIITYMYLSQKEIWISAWSKSPLQENIIL